MKRILHYFTLLLLGFSSWNCADLVEPDLTDSVVELVAPPDSFATSLQTVTFLWAETEDVLTYQLQVVQPDFDTPLNFVLDTSVTADRFVYTLNPGEYAWRVTGKNTNTNTEFQTFKLTVNEDSLLNNQILNLVSPTDNSILNDPVLTFLWQQLTAADSYRIQCASPDFSNSTFVVFDQLVTVDNYTHTLPDGDYRWRVRAENSSGTTQYTEHGFTVDTQVPAAPLLTSPANGDTVVSPVDLDWTYAPDADVDSVFVYSDSLVTLVESDAVLNLPYSFTNGTSGATYFWRVRSYDAGGNGSLFSSTRKFVIN